MEAPRLLLLGPTARRVGLPPAWVKAEAEAGRLPCLKIGKTLFFNPEAIAQLVAERAAQQTLQREGAAHAS